MAGQNVHYVVTGDDRNIIAMFQRDERAAQSLEKSIAGINSGLKDIAMSAGIGFGLHAIFAGAKDWVQDVANLETGMLRIKNASAGFADGVKNQLFIRDEVNKFKIDLDQTADSYGAFLLKIKNAGLGADLSRTMFNNILTVSKAAALPQGEMDAAVRNMGIMLGEGVLEARHLRGLSYVHPQLMPFIADAIGLKDHEKSEHTDRLKKHNVVDMTKMQQLSALISSGSLTKEAISANVIIEALQKYADSVKGNIPDTLHTMNSEITDLSNKWLEFKEVIVMDLKPELVAFFGTLRDGIGWLKENKDGVIYWGGAIAGLVKVWIEYKAVMGAINIVQAAYKGFLTGLAGDELKMVSATELRVKATYEQINATNALTAAIERQMAIAAGGSGLVGYGGMALQQGAIVAGSAKNTAGAGIGSTVFRGVTAVAIAYFAADALAQLAHNRTTGGYKMDYPFDAFGAVTSPNEHQRKVILSTLQKTLDDPTNNWKDLNSSGKNELYTALRQWGYGTGAFTPENLNAMFSVNKYGNLQNDDSTFLSIFKAAGGRVKGEEKENRDKLFNALGFENVPFNGSNFGQQIRYGNILNTGVDKMAKGGNDNGKHLKPPDDKVTGQRVVTYNILHNGKIIGLNVDKQTVGSSADIDLKRVGELIAQSLEAVVYDAEIHAGG